MAKKDTTSIGFEDKIWKAADVLRGNLNASEYEGVVLGLIFLKYISDKFEEKFSELSADEYADEEDKDEYTADNVFFVPKNARWSVISAAAHTPQVGTAIDDAMLAIEQENPRLKGILPKNFARPELDKRRLGDVVDLFSNIQMHSSADEKDLLGRTYEYCLQKFASMEGKNAGEFYTPSCIVRTIVEILQPYEGRVYDPCCGSGGMFVQSAKFISSHQRDLSRISIYGQEANPSTWKMAHMNIAIRGLEANLGKSYADTFFDDQHPSLKADLVEGIIALPNQLFYSTGIPVSLWFLSREKKQPGKTLFIDARSMGEMVSRKVRELRPVEDIAKIADTFHAFQNGTLADEKGFCAVVTTEDIAKQDYILTPGRFVGIADQEDDGEPFEEKMNRLTTELSDLFKKGHELETEIRENLASLGFILTDK